MADQTQKTAVLGDYAVLFRALLPQARGFICHDTRGQVIGSDWPAPGAPALTPAYRDAIAPLLSGQGDNSQGPLALGAFVGFLLPLQDEAGRTLAVLTVLADAAAAGLSTAAVATQLAPATRSLQRELGLRLRVLDSQQKLQVQAAEERLLHQVESLRGERLGCEAALDAVLALCTEHLGVSAGFIVMPDKDIQRVAGTGMSRGEAALLTVDLLEASQATGFDPNSVNQRGELLWVAISQQGQQTQGVFGLSGLKVAGFSERRLARVVRYIASHISSLLDQHFDPVTGLMAWPLLEAEINAALQAGDASDHVVMCCDIDQLHVVNDTFGRAAGDDVLRRFGALLRTVLGGHPASRMAGDNFAVLLRNVDIERARALAEEVCSRFRENVYHSGDRTHRPTVSIGIGPLAGDGESGRGLAAAQVACQAARDRGCGRVEVYESADASIVRRLDDIQLVGYVRNAIENSRIALVAQPLLPLGQGRVPHYREVLARLVNDTGQHVLPRDFMSAAERYQLMEELDRWVITSTLNMLAQKGRHLRGTQARFAINLSGQSLGSDGFLPFVENAIRRSGVPPDLLTFEITESLAVTKMQHAQNLMHVLQKLGCRFSLDDFGTGLSSFAYLKLFPVDTLKIDGSFIRDLTTNVVSQSVVAAIAEVARVMQLDTVAEYVQDQASLDLLRKLNVSYAQGFFVGSTEPLEEAIANIDRAVSTGAGRAVAEAN